MEPKPQPISHRANLDQALRVLAVMRGQLSSMHVRSLEVAKTCGELKVKKLRSEEEERLGESIYDLQMCFCGMHDMLLHITNQCRRLADKADVMPSKVYETHMRLIREKIEDLKKEFEGMSREEALEYLAKGS